MTRRSGWYGPGRIAGQRIPAGRLIGRSHAMTRLLQTGTHESLPRQQESMVIGRRTLATNLWVSQDVTWTRVFCPDEQVAGRRREFARPTDPLAWK
jgi:hypothetical protein